MLQVLVEADWFFGRMSHEAARYACRGGKDIPKKKFIDNTYLVYQNSFEPVLNFKIKEDHFLVVYRVNNYNFEEAIKFNFEEHISGKENLTKQVERQLATYCTKKGNIVISVSKFPRNPIFRRLGSTKQGANTDIGYKMEIKDNDKIRDDDEDPWNH